MTSARVLFTTVLLALLAAGPACKRNRPPDVPTDPAGPDYCLKDTTYTFTTTAADPDGDSIAVRVDWGDSTVTYWEGWFASGETIALNHAWKDTGTYEVRVSAEDQRRLMSDLSGGHLVRVFLRLPVNAPAEPSGPGVGYKDTTCTFTTSAVHPAGSTVAIRFAWGDGDTSGWTAFVASGESVAMSHAWHDTGAYLVTAQAKDTSELLSPWSSAHSITIGLPDTLCKWRLQLAGGAGLRSSPAIAPDGTIFVGSSDSSLYAVNPDGTVKWRYLTGGNVQSSPAIAADGTIHVGSDDGRVYAIGLDGTLKWSSPVPNQYKTSPAVALDGTVYFESWDSIYAFSPDGTCKWTDTIGGTMNATPAIAGDGTAYFMERTITILAATYPDGTQKWRGQGSGYERAGPAIAGDGTIYVLSEWEPYFNLTAYDPYGNQKWHSMSSRNARSPIALATDGTIYFGSTDRCLYAYNPDGTLKWRYETGGVVDAGPAVALDGTIYVGSDDGCLYAVTDDGTLEWRYRTDGSVEASPTIGTDGTVYLASDDGYLYALKGTSPLANSSWPKFHHDLQNTGRAAGFGLWSRMDTVGDPVLAPGSSGFKVRVANAGNAEVVVGSLDFVSGPPNAYMRDFRINGQSGYGFPVPSGQPGAGPDDTLLFSPITVPPNRSMIVELEFLDFHVDSLGLDSIANVAGRDFTFGFADHWVIYVRPGGG
jgi:outer membrane protein assembly factor BamB